MSQKNKEIISYLFWGVCTTVVNWGSYSLFVLVCAKGLEFNQSLTVIISNTLSWVCAVLFSFITNKIWVFESKSFKANILFPEFIKFVSSRLLTGGIEVFLVPIAINLGLNQMIFGIEGALAKIIVSLSIVVVNYFITKFLVFR